MSVPNQLSPASPEAIAVADDLMFEAVAQACVRLCEYASAGSVAAEQRDARGAALALRQAMVTLRAACEVGMLAGGRTVNSLRFPANWSEDDHARYSAERERLLRARMSRNLSQSVAGAEVPLELFPPLPPAQPYPADALGPLQEPAEAIAKEMSGPARDGGAIRTRRRCPCRPSPCGRRTCCLCTVSRARYLSISSASPAPVSVSPRRTINRTRRLPGAKGCFATSTARVRRTGRSNILHGRRSGVKLRATARRSLVEKREALWALGPEPPQPLAPFLTTGDLTIEGLAKIWPHAHPSLGVFTAEGGMFTGGHGMTEENRLRTAAALSELWDGKPTKRLRALDGATILPGRRLSMHLMVQPDAAAQFLANRTLRDQGLLSRMLVAAPESIAGTRFYRDTHPNDEAAIRAFDARILSILETPTALVPGTRNELAPRILPMSPSAERYWKACHDNVELQSGTSGELANISDFAAKAPEHAARIAAVLAIFNDVTAAGIGAEAMEGGIRLAEWYIGEALRLTMAARTDPLLLRAASLLDWLRGRPEDTFQVRDVLRLGPAALRTNAMAEEAVRILIEHHWLSEASKRPRILMLHRAT